MNHYLKFLFLAFLVSLQACTAEEVPVEQSQVQQTPKAQPVRPEKKIPSGERALSPQPASQKAEPEKDQVLQKLKQEELKESFEDSDAEEGLFNRDDNPDDDMQRLD